MMWRNIRLRICNMHVVTFLKICMRYRMMLLMKKAKIHKIEKDILRTNKVLAVSTTK